MYNKLKILPYYIITELKFLLNILGATIIHILI